MTFDDAVLALRAGRLDDAELVCRGILRSVPEHADSLNVLGIIALQRGQAAVARDFLEKALTQDAQNPAYHANLAKILVAQENPSESEVHFREALRLDSNNADAYAGFGHLLRSQKRLSEASDCFSELVRLRPDDPDLYAVYGSVLQDAGRLREAELRYREACYLKPDYPEVFNNLGNLLQAAGRFSEAEAHFRQALSLKSDFPEAYSNLGNLLLACRRADEAESHCREALRLRPEYASAHCNLANVLIERDEHKTAEFHYREAIRLKPDYPEAHNNLGSLFGRQCQLDEAISFYRRAIELRPDYHDAHTNLGMTLLGAGEFKEGWRAYDAHRKIEERKDLIGPCWGGEDLGGGVLLLYAEQGYGDVIQFCRFLPLVASRARVVFQVPRELVALLENLPGIDQIVARGDPLPPYDAHCALMSLPRWLGITLERVLGDTPYLSADPQKKKKWRDRVKPLPGLRVGLAWAGNPALLDDRRRSISLDKFRCLAEVSGVSFVSLQKRKAAEQTLSPFPGILVHDWTAELHDFADTAALVSELDLVISVDTSVVHLTGALGRPVWLLNRFNSCWRWLLDNERSPWYGTLRQFKQLMPGDWDGVFAQVKAALAARVAEGVRSSNPLAGIDTTEIQYREAVRLNPDSVDAHTALGMMLQDNGRFEDAEPCLREACRISPGSAVACNNLGILHCRQNRLEEAEERFRSALELDPNFPTVHANLGSILWHRREMDDAERHCRRALDLQPDLAEAHFVLAQLLDAHELYQEAERHYRQALRINPNHADWHNQFGKLLIELRRLKEARASLDVAIGLQPDHPEAHSNLAIMMLLGGDLIEGWQEYEWRWKLKQLPGRLYDFAEPVWNGEEIVGRTLLIHAEQGFGDTIQFCRLIPLLKTGASVVLEVQAALVDLLGNLPGVDQIVPRGNPLPPFDVHCPLLSLPRLLGLSLRGIPGQLRYLSADPMRVLKWRERLDQITGLRVGLAWGGSPTMADDSRRSIALDKLAALAGIPGVSFVSLQKSAPEQGLSLPAGMVLHDWTDELHDFSDTAALIENLDLTISVDTAVVHVAGALGRPVWMLNRFSGCWRWLLDREDSPWYPSLRQFRQSRPGDWDSVILKIRAALEQEVLVSAAAVKRSRIGATALSLSASASTS